jgi:hypothetical protein
MRMSSLRTGLLSVTGAACLLAGCGETPDAAFPRWAETPSVTPAATPERNAFDEYAAAAEQAEEAADRYLRRVWFTPEMRSQVLARTAEPVRRIERATALACEFRFEPLQPFEPAPYHAGWRLLGHALVWSVQADCAREDFDAAVRTAVAATTFGFDLTGGSAVDASLGLAIADEVRAVLVPHLPKMSPAQLQTLAQGYVRALERKPTLERAFENERHNMLLGVQMIQDAYRDHKLGDVREKLGIEVRDAIVYLEGLRSKDAERRPAYFEGFAREVDEEVAWLQRVAVLPAAKREADPGPKLAEERPWRRFAKHLLRSGRPLLPVNDATLARTRLLVLHAHILGEIKTTGQAPANLDATPRELNQDPFTGLPFLYRSHGAEYYVYSAGPNFRDDGGETDEIFTYPDLVLEGSID